LPSKKKYDWNNFTNPLHEQVWQTSLGINASRQPMVVGEKSNIDFLALTAPYLPLCWSLAAQHCSRTLAYFRSVVKRLTMGARQIYFIFEKYYFQNSSPKIQSLLSRNSCGANSTILPFGIRRG